MRGTERLVERGKDYPHLGNFAASNLRATVPPTWPVIPVMAYMMPSLSLECQSRTKIFMSEFHALFIMGFVAVFAPLLARLPAFIRMPAVVLELMLGIVIGPSGVGWVTSQG